MLSLILVPNKVKNINKAEYLQDWPASHISVTFLLLIPDFKTPKWQISQLIGDKVSEIQERGHASKHASSGSHLQGVQNY